MTTATTCALYLRRDNQTFQMPARQFRKLVKELQAGRGQEQIVDLMMSGYDGFLAADGEVHCLDSLTLEMILA